MIFILPKQNPLQNHWEKSFGASGGEELKTKYIEPYKPTEVTNKNLGDSWWTHRLLGWNKNYQNSNLSKNILQGILGSRGGVSFSGLQTKPTTSGCGSFLRPSNIGGEQGQIGHRSTQGFQDGQTPNCHLTNWAAVGKSLAWLSNHEMLSWFIGILINGLWNNAYING